MAALTPTQDAALMKLAQRTVGFLTLVNVDGVEYLEPKGSGTIVLLKDEKFFVTAGHVAREILKAPRAGIYGLRRPGKPVRPVEFNPEFCDSVVHWNGEQSPIGPDIAAIKLPPDVTAAIEHNLVPYNLERRAALGDELPPAPDLILSGYPSTATLRNIWTTDSERKDMVTIHLNAGRRITPFVVDKEGFDSFEFAGTYLDTKAPATFAGVSGGGLWVLAADDPETVPILFGIAYYQSDAMPDGNRVLTCAGPKAIYGRLLQDAWDKWVTN